MNHLSQYANRLGRRGFLHTGVCTALGLSLGDFFKMQARADQKNYESKEGVAKSVVHIFLPGGMAHQESFDPKPFAAPEYKGPLGVINTNVDGIQLGELWKQTATVADKLVFIRSMTHGEAAHERGTHNMFTGYRPSPALQYPSFGSVVSHEFGTRKNLPPYVCIPSQPNEFAGSGYLSSAYGPFSLGADPASGNFKVQDLALPGGVTEGRFDRRRTILAGIDDHFKSLEKSDSLNAMDKFYQDAYKLISSPEAREAFALEKEADKLKDEYGRNEAGMRLLMARRLVESGVRFVSLTYGGWDHHDNIKGAMEGQVPKFDQAFARFIRDLSERGLLDSTLVMISSEFGRTPKTNATGGRDHWPKVFSTVLAGGGLKKGIVYGSSDALGAEPDNDPVQVGDLAFTIYNQLGINADKELMAPGARPIEIVGEGQVIKDILADIDHMAQKHSSLFECTVLPAMVILPVVAMFVFQHRLVKPPEAAAGKPAEEDSSHFNGFPYLQLAGETYRAGHAVERFTKLVAQREAELGRMDPETLIQRNNLANALLADKRYVEAEAQQRALLKDMEVSLAPEHPDTFRCRFNLALNLRMQGKVTDARSEMEKVYAGWKDVLGEGHPRTQSALLVLEQLRSPL